MFPRLGRSEGQAAAEFVITLPLLLAMIWALAQFGILFAHWVTLTRAVSAGARKAAVCRFAAGDDPKTVVVNDGAGLRLNTGQVSVTGASGWPCTGATPGVSTVTVAVNGSTAGDNNRVCQSFDIWFVGTLGTICVGASSTEQVE
jgi:TadE-like protein